MKQTWNSFEDYDVYMINFLDESYFKKKRGLRVPLKWKL